MVAMSQMPHVVYVVSDPGVPAYGHKGASVHVQSVLREMCRPDDSHLSVSLVATRLGGPVPPGLERVQAIELGRPQADGAAAAERALTDLDEVAAQRVVERIEAARAADRHRDVVVYQRYGLWSARVLEAARAAGAATVLELNAPLVQEQQRHRELVDEAGAVELTRRAVRAAHVPYAVSTPVAQWAADLAGVGVGVVPNGVDVTRFAPRVAPVAGERRGPWAGSRVPGSPRPESPRPVIAFVGTFRPWHGPDLLVEAVARVAADGVPTELLLIGDGPLLPQVTDRARDLGVPVTSTGSVPPAQIPDLLARADLACAPYPAADAYFSPLKVVEYLAAGLPTVAAGIGDLPALIGPDEAVLVPPGDTDALAAALRRIVLDDDLRARLGTAGWRAANERFGWDTVVRRVLEAAAARTVDALGPVSLQPSGTGLDAGTTPQGTPLEVPV